MLFPVNSNLDDFKTHSEGGSRLIGTYKGKPLYELIIEGVFNDTTSLSTTILGEWNTNTMDLVSVSGRLNTVSGSQAQLGAYINSSYYSGFYVGTNGLVIYHSAGVYSEYRVVINYIRK